MTISRKSIACDECRQTEPMPPMRVCHKCRKNYHDEYYQANRTILIQRTKKWKDENKELSLKHRRDYWGRSGSEVYKVWRAKNLVAHNESNRRCKYKKNYGELGEVKATLDKLAREISGNPKSFFRI